MFRGHPKLSEEPIPNVSLPPNKGPEVLTDSLPTNDRLLAWRLLLGYLMVFFHSYHYGQLPMNSG